jgi:Domain of unknown function (DUF4260)
MSDPHHTSTDNRDDIAHSTPRRWLRLDGLTLFAAAIALFATTGQTWWLLPVVILLPDLFMVGYLRGTRIGANVYNLGHTYLLPAALSLAAAADHHPLPLAVGLLWLAHIGMDRALGYGIKYTDDFTWWRTTVVDKPTRLEFDNGLAGDDGEPMPGLAPAGGIVTFDAVAASTRLTILTQFVDVEQMQMMIGVGMQEGMTAAVGQIDASLAATSNATR